MNLFISARFLSTEIQVPWIYRDIFVIWQGQKSDLDTIPDIKEYIWNASDLGPKYCIIYICACYYLHSQHLSIFWEQNYLAERTILTQDLPSSFMMFSQDLDSIIDTAKQCYHNVAGGPYSRDFYTTNLESSRKAKQYGRTLKNRHPVLKPAW